MQFGAKVAKPGATLVYPQEIRDIIRERFPAADAGKFDSQYNQENVSFRYS